MKNRKLSLALRWIATLGGTLFGMAMNALAVTMLAARQPHKGDFITLFIIAIFAGGGVCGALAGRWADRYTEERK